MKTLKKSALIALLLPACFTTQAITNTAIAVSGTNIVLSWPSYGYEIYLVQSRQSLSATDAWSCVTNAYPANSTNRTTFTIYGVVPPPAIGGGSGNYRGGLSPSLNLASSSMMAGGMGPLAVPVDGKGSVVPVVLYPPCFDLSGFTIYDPLTGESVNGANYERSPLSLQTRQMQNTIQTSDDSQSSDSGSGDPPAPTTGFFCVYHIPNFPAGITNYTFDGPTFIPVDYASPDADPSYVDNTTVLINGQPTDHAVFMPYPYGGVTNWGVGIYFDRLANGTNTIQLLTTVRQSDILNDQTPYIVFSNAPATITINNLICYTNWSDLILGTNYTFKAKSRVTNVDWEIDIYDVNGDFVNYQTGHSSDGNIVWTWDLYDYWGNPRSGDSDPFFYPYITITGDLGNSAQNAGNDPSANNSSASQWMSPFAGQYPSQGSWLFAYLDKNYDDGTTNYAGADYYYTNGIHTLEGGPFEWGIAFWECVLKFGRTYSQADRDGSWQGTTNTLGLTGYLRLWTIRSFYYYGHGAANLVGGDISLLDISNNITGSTNFPGSKAKLTSQWVHDNVTFDHLYGGIPFRFVFLDGCNTATGNWPWAWGVPKQTVGADWYRNPANNPTGARPNAFVGWDTEVGGPGWGRVREAWEFRKLWMLNWSGVFQQHMNYAFEFARDNSGWVPPSYITDHLKEYGYILMTFDEYNHSGSWP